MSHNAFSALSLTDERDPKLLARQQSNRARRRLEKQAMQEETLWHEQAGAHKPLLLTQSYQSQSQQQKQPQQQQRRQGVTPPPSISWEAAAAAAAAGVNDGGWEEAGDADAGWGSPEDHGWGSPPAARAAGCLEPNRVNAIAKDDNQEDWLFGAPPAVLAQQGNHQKSYEQQQQQQQHKQQRVSDTPQPRTPASTIGPLSGGRQAAAPAGAPHQRACYSPVLTGQSPLTSSNARGDADEDVALVAAVVSADLDLEGCELGSAAAGCSAVNSVNSAAAASASNAELFEQLIAQQAAAWAKLQQEARAVAAKCGAAAPSASGSAAAAAPAVGAGAAPWGKRGGNAGSLGHGSVKGSASSTPRGEWPALVEEGSMKQGGGAWGNAPREAGLDPAGLSDFEYAMLLQRQEEEAAEATVAAAAMSVGSGVGSAWQCGGMSGVEVVCNGGLSGSSIVSMPGPPPKMAVATAAAVNSPLTGPCTPPSNSGPSDFLPLEPSQSSSRGAVGLPPAASPSKVHGWTTVARKPHAHSAGKRSASAHRGGAGGEVRVLHVAAASGSSSGTVTPSTGYGGTGVTPEELHERLLLSGMVPLERKKCEGGEDGTGRGGGGGRGSDSDDEALARTLHLSEMQQLQEEASQVGGGVGGRDAYSVETIWHMMEKTARKQQRQEGGGAEQAWEEEAEEGFAGGKATYGREWHVILRAMTAAGWHPVSCVKHPKFERILPLSGKRQVVTLPSTPSDAIRGVRNSAADLQRLDTEAKELERRAKEMLNAAGVK